MVSFYLSYGTKTTLKSCFQCKNGKMLPCMYVRCCFGCHYKRLQNMKCTSVLWNLIHNVISLPDTFRVIISVNFFLAHNFRMKGQL